MEFKQDITNKYMYCYCPNHELANGAGKVMEHTYVMVNHIGRLLYPNECVHHKDRNRANNDIANLQLMTNQEHSKLHAREDGKDTQVSFLCGSCGSSFEDYPRNNRMFCSNECRGHSKRKFDPTPEELEVLVWQLPTVKVAALFGVSDTAVAKRCKRYGIDKPPRGYWAKQKSKTMID